MSSVIKFLLKRVLAGVGLQMSAGCLFSGSPHPCAPCVWAHLVHLLLLLAGVLLVGLVMMGGPPSTVAWQRLRGRRGAQALGVGGRSLAVLLGGDLGGTPSPAITSTTAWLAIQDSDGFHGGKHEAHLFVGVQGQGRDECLLQALPTSIACIVVHDYYVVQVGEVIPPCIGAEGAKGELYGLIPQINLEPPQACSSVKLS